MSTDEVFVPLPNVTRIEVIDSMGRAFTRYYEIAGCSVQTQDGTRTLKIFANIPVGMSEEIAAHALPGSQTPVEPVVMPPHRFLPDWLTMGDCSVCGNTSGAAIHATPDLPTTERQS